MTESYEITGRTRLFGIVADPVHQVKTPQAINDRMRAQGFDGVLVPFHVAPDGLADFMAGLRRLQNFGGFIATVPHKSAMVALCDEVDAHSRLIGAVNCIRRDPDGRLIGTMLDGRGFVQGLYNDGIDPAGRRVYLAGAGGAAAAIAFALAEAGIASLTITNRTRSRSVALAERLARLYPKLAVVITPATLAEHDLVVNATSLGLRDGDPLPIDARQLSAGQIVAEVIMDPELTPLLHAARAAGCRIHPGYPMLAEQLTLMMAHMGAM
jgi:shikimate dehydrogenase